jgi:hypothetical protein
MAKMLLGTTKKWRHFFPLLSGHNLLEARDIVVGAIKKW